MRAYFFAILITLSVGCQSLRITQSRQQIKKVFNQSLLSKHFTGFALYDPTTKEWLYEQNTDKYFTPASNVKTLSLYAGVKLIGDSLPALSYMYSGDTLIFSGTGDPTFLHPDFEQQPVYDFLSNHRGPLIYAPRTLKGNSYGPGWSWDDYQYAFQPERSTFPIYGNVVRITTALNKEPDVYPQLFDDAIINSTLQTSEIRYPESNVFVVNQSNDKEGVVPFRTYPELVASLLMDTLKKKVTIQEREFRGRLVYSQPSASLYSIMMKRSDNLYAEQILIMGAFSFSGVLNPEVSINHVMTTYLRDLPDQPSWVDGSGLSRYNLITPRSQVRLLEKIRNDMTDRWVQSIFPVGGQSGTIKNWYGKPGLPYVFAKTGTLRNNHNLSGYLVTNSGKTLIFSFMNNNYVASNDQVKREMQKVLELIRDSF